MTLLFTVSFMNTKALIDFCFLLRYAALAPLYYRGAAVAVIVYDITSPETFNKAQYWVKVVCLDPDFILSLSLSLAHIPISSSFSSSLSHTCWHIYVGDEFGLFNLNYCYIALKHHIYIYLKKKSVCKISFPILRCEPNILKIETIIQRHEFRIQNKISLKHKPEATKIC